MTTEILSHFSQKIYGGLCQKTLLSAVLRMVTECDRSINCYFLTKISYMVDQINMTNIPASELIL